MVEKDFMIQNGKCISIGFLESHLLVGGNDGVDHDEILGDDDYGNYGDGDDEACQRPLLPSRRVNKLHCQRRD